MIKKLLTLTIIIILLITITLSGCNSSSESLAVFKMEPFTIYFNDTEITRTLTLDVYYKDGYVTRTEMTEVNTVIDGNEFIMSELKKNTNLSVEAFSSEVFKMKGFNFSCEFADSSYTFITTYDYSKINIKKELDNGKKFIHVTGMIDEDFKVPYEKLKEAYIIIGYSYEENQT